VADTRQQPPPPRASPKQKKHLGQQSHSAWEAVLGFPLPSIKHFASDIYLKVSSEKSLSLPTFPKPPENFIAASLLSVVLYTEDAQDNIFQAPLGPHPTNFYLTPLSTFENLTNSYGRDIKPKERLIRSTARFSVARFGRM